MILTECLLTFWKKQTKENRGREDVQELDKNCHEGRKTKQGNMKDEKKIKGTGIFVMQEERNFKENEERSDQKRQKEVNGQMHVEWHRFSSSHVVIIVQTPSSLWSYGHN